MAWIRTVPREICDRFALLGGAALLAILGRDRFYYLSQEEKFLSPLARSFAEHRYVLHVVDGWREVRNDRDRTGRSVASMSEYGDASLGGYGKINLTTGDAHLPLPKQMRGILYDRVCQAVRDGTKTVLEIGTGNGDVVALLAEEFPDVHFTGVDFDVSNATEKHVARNNLKFVAGYPLELLESGDLDAELMFAASTFTVVGPVELDRYAEVFKERNFNTIMLTDPATRSWHPDRYPGGSRHMYRGMWGHDYRVPFGAAGYRTAEHGVEIFEGHKKMARAPFQIYVGKLDS